MLPMLHSPNRGWHARGYLPHFESATAIQMVTYRLADALPKEVMDRLRCECDGQGEHADIVFRRRVEEWLDAGHGSCVLNQAECAELVVNAWKHFDGVRYHLHAWMVMPNHVHLIVQMLEGHALSEAVESWKRFTATRINRLLGRKGNFWLEDYWDRYVRDETHYQNAVAYVHENPVKAGLVEKTEDWAWSSAKAWGVAEG
jgi:REP element-mobilizing transposase RayT